MLTLRQTHGVKNTKSRLSCFLFSFSFSLLFFIFLSLELRVRISDNITQSYISHIRWYSDCDSHRAQDTGKNVEDSERMISYNMLNACWPWDIYMAV